MPGQQIEIGRVVRSQAGRDAGKLYLVTGVAEPSIVLLADGRGRRVANLKKKNIRHISVLAVVDKGIAAKIASGLQVTDEDIRAALTACECTGEQ